MPKPLDLTGQQFGRLTVIRPTERRENRKVVWQCTCACGNTAYKRSDVLRRGQARSCGCLSREVSRERMRAVQAAIRATRPTRARRPLKARPGPGSDRQVEALALRQQGRTFAEIGAALGVTRQRAAQLVQAAEGEKARAPRGEPSG
ncbi:MAG: hypothetical protein L0Z62_08080 [Gemmataceae bacterium]|nr:hypothetical protein [Gemmataceae bacterium]